MKKSVWLILLCVFIFGNIVFAQTPNWQWAKAGSGPIKYAHNSSVVSDAQNNVYITGSYDSTITLGAITLSGKARSAFVAKFDSLGNVLWAKSSTGSGGALGVTTDVQGNVFITGGFDSVITFGSYTLSNPSIGNTGSNFFIVKYDSHGNVLWAKGSSAPGASNGNTAYSVGNNIGADAFGNVYATGTFSSINITFGNYTLINTDTLLNQNNYGAAAENVFIVKYNAAGTVVWAKALKGAAYGPTVETATSNAYGLGVDVGGNVIISGSFNDSLMLDNIVLKAIRPFADFFIAKFDSLGHTLWAQQAVSSSDYSMGYGVSTDAAGNIYAAGNFGCYTLTFGNTVLTNTGSGNIFIVKYGPAGNLIWANRAGGTASDECMGISANADGSFYICGAFTSHTLTFGASTMTNGGTANVYVAAYDASGNALWSRSAYAPGNDVMNSVCAQSNGSACVAGDFTSSDFGFGYTTLPNPTGSNIFVARFADCAPPVDPVSTTATASLSICVGQATHLSVNAAGVVQWFSVDSGGSNLAQGSSFVTPALDTSTTYFVQDSTCGISNRIAIAVTVNQNPGVPVITHTGTGTLSTGSFSGYQWILNGAPITGANQQTYNATANGNYQVVVTNASGCSDTSAVYTLTGVGISNITADNISVYPNPANSTFYFNGLPDACTITICNVLGEEVFNATSESSTYKITLASKGIYFYRINNGNTGVKTGKIVVE